MTRINLVPPQILTDQHLLAETREITRLPNNYTRMSKTAKIPFEYCLGTGHVLFFVMKPFFTLNRYLELREECRIRKFNVQDFSSNWDVYKFYERTEYIPKLKDKKLNVERIKEKIFMKPEWYRLNGTPINPNEYIFELDNIINL